MKFFTTVLLLVATKLCLGQQTVQYADSIRKAYSIPEVSYAIINSHSTLEIASLGRHSVHLPDTATVEDRFHIGSNTKAMTAFIIANYVEKGKLKWNTKFFDVFPEWKQNSLPQYVNITLLDLLSHKAGIQPFQGRMIRKFLHSKEQTRRNENNSDSLY